jgi:hypothetical protein
MIESSIDTAARLQDAAVLSRDHQQDAFVANQRGITKSDQGVIAGLIVLEKLDDMPRCILCYTMTIHHEVQKQPLESRGMV